MEKPSNVCFGSDEFTQTVAICTTVLGQDELCHFGIGAFDVYRVFKVFLINPHNFYASLLNIFSQGQGSEIHVHWEFFIVPGVRVP